MIVFFILAGTGLLLLGLIYLLSLTPPNTICPRCKKRKPFKQHGWKMICQKCEGGEND